MPASVFKYLASRGDPRSSGVDRNSIDENDKEFQEFIHKIQ